MRIGVDLMGSDRSPHAVFEAVLQAAHELDRSHTLVAIATHSVVVELKQRHAATLQQLSILFHPVKDAITMADEPLLAVSRKPEASLVVGIRLLKRQKIDAFVSAGNTGALVASAALNLPLLPGIKRPALLVSLPTVTGNVAVLDVGGNVSCKAHHLVQFSYMGAAYQHIHDVEKPKVGLLNIGVEAKKGTSVLRQAYEILRNDNNPRLHFIGNIEPRDLFKGSADVLVTDGFTGNVLLKTSEGVSSFIFQFIQEIIQQQSSEKLQEALLDLKRYFSSTDYPGAIICGVEGIVIKCHGNAAQKAMVSSIKGAADLVSRNLITNLKEQLAQLSQSA